MKLEELLEILRVLNNMDTHPDTSEKRDELANLVMKLIKEQIA